MAKERLELAQSIGDSLAADYQTKALAGWGRAGEAGEGLFALLAAQLRHWDQQAQPIARASCSPAMFTAAMSEAGKRMQIRSDPSCVIEVDGAEWVLYAQGDYEDDQVTISGMNIEGPLNLYLPPAGLDEEQGLVYQDLRAKGLGPSQAIKTMKDTLSIPRRTRTTGGLGRGRT